VLKVGRGLAYIGFLLMPALYLRLWGNFNLSDIFILAAFFIFLTHYPSQVFFTMVKNPLNIPLSIFLFGFSLSTMFAEQPIECFFALIQLLTCIYILTTLIYFCNIKKVLQVIVITTAIHVVLLILFEFGILNIGNMYDKSRFSWVSVNANITARVCFVGFVIMVFSLRGKPWFWLKIGTLYSILATISRSALLALLTMLISKQRIVSVLILIFIALSAFGLVKYVPSVLNIDIISHYNSRLISLLRFEESSAQIRMRMYTVGPELFFGKYFIIGVGMDNATIIGHAHNVMLCVAIGNGIFGLIGYLLMYIIILMIAWKIERKFGMLMILVLGTFVFDMFMAVSENRIYWFPFSLTIAIYLKRISFSHKHSGGDKDTDYTKLW